MTPIVKFKKLHPNAIIPEYKTAGAAGMDLCWDGLVPNGPPGWAGGPCASIDLGGGPAKLCTGLAIELPEGYEAQIRPRSSLSSKGILCHLGTIDSDFRGELIVLLQDTLSQHRMHAPPDHRIRAGDRIAQLVIAPIARAQIEVVEQLSSTARGTGGFGSTGR